MGMNSPLEAEKKKNLALTQGLAYSLALDEMKEEDVHAAVEVEDYIVSLSCEDAEGMYMDHGKGELEWMIPAPNENIHVEVVVQDKDDKRFLPGLDVQCVLEDDDHTEVASFTIPFIWHPFLFHYGINTTIPKAGEYFARITIKKPTFHRHDQVFGKRYENDVTVTLGPVHLKPGKKKYGEE